VNFETGVTLTKSAVTGGNVRWIQQILKCQIA